MERLVLFGSQATGKVHEASDIDVVVVSHDFEKKSFWDRVDILTQGILQVWEPIEAIAKTPAEWDNEDSLFLEHVRGECVVVYDSRALAAPIVH